MDHCNDSLFLLPVHISVQMFSRRMKTELLIQMDGVRAGKASEQVKIVDTTIRSGIHILSILTTTCHMIRFFSMAFVAD